MKERGFQNRVSKLREQTHFSFADLTEITEILRGEGGCPWDREQTHQSVRNCMIEEAYEVVEAIDTQNMVLLQEELGDVLFQVTFHTELAREEGSFTSQDVLDGICRKMIERHPHVFGEMKVASGEEALSQWEQIKRVEKQRKTLSSRLRAVPPMLPALMRAQKIAGKIDPIPGATEKLTALAGEFAKNGSAETLGELLYLCVCVANEKGLGAEETLTKTTEKVIRRVESEEKSQKI